MATEVNRQRRPALTRARWIRRRLLAGMIRGLQEAGLSPAQVAELVRGLPGGGAADYSARQQEGACQSSPTSSS
ncbi:MAG: hypothetical protein ACP5G2_07440 [Candidatus Bipolaricaulaceae bacterium]